MKITGLAAGYSDPTTFGRRQDAVDAGGTKAAESAAKPISARGDASSILQEIVTQYDVTDMSPQEFSEMIQKMHQAGALSDSQFQELSLVRLDLDAEGIGPNDKVNLVDLYQKKLRNLLEQQRQAAESGEAPPAAPDVWEPIERRREWLEKFAVMQSAPDAIGLDLAA